MAKPKIRQVDFSPDEWLQGTRLLAPAERGVYITICAMIYSEGGPLSASDEDLAYENRMTVEEFQAALAELMKRGKLRRVRGKLSNDRCDVEIMRSLRRIKNAREAGRAGGKSKGKSNPQEDKGNSPSDGLADAQAPAKPDPKLTNQLPTNQLTTDPKGSDSPPNPHADPPDQPGLPIDAAPPKRDDVTAAFDAWNALARETGLPIAKQLNRQRRKSLAARLAEADPPGLPGWLAALAKVRDSPFLRGGGREGWRADLDFVLQAKSFTKLIEGGYDRHDTSPLPARTAAGQPSSFSAVLAGARAAVARGQR